MNGNQEVMRLVKDTIISLSELKDDSRKEFAILSYPTQLKVLGVRNPDLKLVIKELRVLTKDWDLNTKLLLSKEFISSGIMECVQLSFEYLGLEKKALQLFSKSNLPFYLKVMDNWVCVDTFGVHVLGIAWRNGQINDHTIKELAQSNDFWIRRLALTATIPFNMKSRGGKGNAEKTLMICEILVSDKNEMIQKALSWALRELLPFNRLALEEFMLKYDHKLSARVKREVKTKLTTGKKN
jgi:3-methyladenine DNA glycosylase AlkD